MSIIRYFSVLIPLLILDLSWLGLVAKSFYQKHLGYLTAGKFLLWPAVIFYPLYAFGLVIFVVNPALEQKSLLAALWRGALFGLIAYATYDLSNQATIDRWPMIVTIVDIIWGALVSMIVCAAAYLFATKFNG